MQRLAQLAFIGLVATLSSCGSEPEAGSDITEAIPLNIDDEAAAGTETTGSDAIAQDVQNAAGTPDLPNATTTDPLSAEASDSNTPSASAQRALPETMQSGSNPPDFEPPKGSKVQRFN